MEESPAWLPDETTDRDRQRERETNRAATKMR